MSRQAEDTQERHDCSIQGCASWGVQRWRGTIPGVLEYVDGWLCENHKITLQQESYSVGYQIQGEAYLHLAGQDKPVRVVEGMTIPPGQHGITVVNENTPIPFRPNRADRRKAARGKR